MRKMYNNVLGEKRIREGFLWFPKRIENEKRWLEHAKWEEVWDVIVWEAPVWEATRWIDEEEE